MLYFDSYDWTLFLSALISSTLFPGGSEALLVYRLGEENTHVYSLILIATSGNVLGSMITYMMGSAGFQYGQKWFRIPQNKIARAEHHFRRFGTPALLFAWLPIIGDPLCLVAGSLRYNFFLFILLVSLGKLSRYSLLAWAFL